MKFTVNEIAALLNGAVEGDGSKTIESFAPIEQAGEGDLTFLSNTKYTPFIYSTQASAVLVDKQFKPEKPTPVLIRVDDVYSTLSKLLERFQNQEVNKTGIEHPVSIHSSAKIGEGVYVGAFSYVGHEAMIGNGSKVFPQSYIGDRVTVGENTIIYAGVKIYPGCQIGNNCIIHSGAVIGSDGFGFAPQEDGSFSKIPQLGIVILRDNVEIGANTTIDRATMKATVIENGVKLDNLIQVAHNVEIGANTAIAAQTGISGSTKIGKNSLIGGQVGIVGHIEIAEGSMIGAQSGVAHSITEKNQKWFGSPIDKHKNAFRASIVFKRLPELYDRIKELEKEVFSSQKNRTDKDEH